MALIGLDGKLTHACEATLHGKQLLMVQRQNKLLARLQVRLEVNASG